MTIPHLYFGILAFELFFAGALLLALVVGAHDLVLWLIERKRFK